MHFTQLITVLATSLAVSDALVAHAGAGALKHLRANNRVEQVEAGTKPPGPVAMLHAFAKYQKPAPAHVHLAATSAIAAAATLTQSGSLQASGLANDRAYYCNVTVGKSQMVLNLDTGSSDFWVFSTKMPDGQQVGHKLYELGGVPQSNETFSILYGDGGKARGDMYTETVKIGGITASSMPVGAADFISGHLTGMSLDGVIGLGFQQGSTCSPHRCATFIDTLAPILPLPLFTATLRHNAPGTYDFGFLDPTKYTGAISYVPVTSIHRMGYWEFISGGFSTGSGEKVEHSMDVVADTGTSLTVVDQLVLDAYYAPVEGARYDETWAGWIFPCANADSLPDLSYYIGGAKHTMPGAYGNFGTLGQPAGYCFGGVQSNKAFNFTILGDSFLKSQYVVFDYGAPNGTSRVGFAQQAGVEL